MNNQTKQECFLRRKDVQKRTGLPQSTMYLKMSLGEFPKPVMLSKRTVAWVSSEIDTWIEECISKSRCHQIKSK